jgi:hypothetical protein
MEYRAFRFRVRHDVFLRLRLKQASPAETLAIAHNLGFLITSQDLELAHQSASRRRKTRARKRSLT